jgi:hypothetical protein
MKFINRKNFVVCLLVTGCIIATAALMPSVGSAQTDNVRASVGPVIAMIASAMIKKGEAYYADATIPYITGYEPIKDASGGTIIASAVAAMTFPLSGIIAEHHDHDHGYQFGNPCWSGPIWVCGGDWDY